jgi:hypothetical protein
MNFFKKKQCAKWGSMGLLALASFGFGGCASIVYVEPTQGDRARVRFATSTTAVTVLRSYDDRACSTNEQEWMRLRNGYLVSSSPKRLGIPLWAHHENAAKEVHVNATKPQTLMFFGSETVGTTIYSCGVPLTYKFEKNRDYEVDYVMKAPSCQATIYEISSKEGGGVRTALSTFTNRTSPETATCLDQFKKTRLY